MRLGLFQTLRDHIQFCLRLPERYSRFQSRDGAERARPPRVLAVLEWVEAEGQPDFGLFRKTGKAKARRQYAADFARLPVERDRLADQSGICAETPAPQAVADKHGGGMAWIILLGAKGAAQQWLHAQRRKEISRDNRVLHALRLLALRQV